jgi:hypothetical protein
MTDHPAMDVLSWLLNSDPALRWQVMRDLTGESAGVMADERARVAGEGWGARYLDLQGADGNWGGGAYSPKWVSTTYTLLDLRHLGVDPADPRVAASTERVRERVTMGRASQPFFSYVGETCITGMGLALSSYFLGEADDGSAVVDWLLDQQLADGGWNCATSRGSTRSSFNTTISVLEGLLERERARGRSTEVDEARRRGHEYLLTRGMFRSARTGQVVDARWKLFSFPPRWHYDVLRGLDYLRAAEAIPDSRVDEAIRLVESKRRSDGRWPLQNRHPGLEHFAMEDGPGRPSRWNTLRALRVLDWKSGGISRELAEEAVSDDR